MKKILIHVVAAARPNFMKVAPLMRELRATPWARAELVHTGQHYDFRMSDTFFDELGLGAPDHHLGVGSGSHAEQTGRVMIAYEALATRERPDWVVVVGDVNSTLACALAGAKLGIRVAHLEAGLRSFDRTMPEELNRILTDQLADLLWAPSEDGMAHLQAEGIAAHRIEMVGNIMIDCFEMMRPAIEARGGARLAGPRPYGVVTLHRPSNVDDRAKLEMLADRLAAVAERVPLVFPVHPRTAERLRGFGLLERLSGLTLTDPLGYLDFMSLVCGSRLVITDSGGIQEETTHLGLPCLTLRENTERPVTITHGTNRLVAPETLVENVEAVLRGDWPQGRRPPLWDGRTAGRVVASLAARCNIQA